MSSLFPIHHPLCRLKTWRDLELLRIRNHGIMDSSSPTIWGGTLVIPHLLPADSSRILAQPRPFLEGHRPANAPLLPPQWVSHCGPWRQSLGRAWVHLLNRYELCGRRANKGALREDQPVAPNASLEEGGLELGDVEQPLCLQQCSWCREGHYRSSLSCLVTLLLVYPTKN